MMHPGEVWENTEVGWVFVVIRRAKHGNGAFVEAACIVPSSSSPNTTPAGGIFEADVRWAELPYFTRLA